MLQFCFWLSLSNHSPGNQVVHLCFSQPLLQQHLPGVVCANIKNLPGLCKYKKPAQCKSVENTPSVCKSQNISHLVCKPNSIVFEESDADAGVRLSTGAGRGIPPRRKEFLKDKKLSKKSTIHLARF